MNGIQVQLTEMLLCRERRANLQTEYISQYHCPVLSFTMNIPGPIKTTETIRAAFKMGKAALMQALLEKNAEILQTSEFHESTGDELIMAIRLSAKQLKELTIKLEESHPFGRLFDMDVIDTDGTKLSRTLPRKCLICNRPAHACARSRTHSVKDMQDAIERLLQ